MHTQGSQFMSLSELSGWVTVLVVFLLFSNQHKAKVGHSLKLGENRESVSVVVEHATCKYSCNVSIQTNAHCMPKFLNDAKFMCK